MNESQLWFIPTEINGFSTNSLTYVKNQNPLNKLEILEEDLFYNNTKFPCYLYTLFQYFQDNSKLGKNEIIRWKLGQGRNKKSKIL